MSDLVTWITRLFRDCVARAPFGVGLELDRAQPPLVASISPADRPTGYVRLDRDDIGARIDFACRLQQLLDVDLDGPAPLCRTHNLGLVPKRAGDEMLWSCPEGDFSCEVGAYEMSAFWPPTKVDRWAPSLLAKRFRQFAVTGIASFSVTDRHGEPVATVRLRPDGDEEAVRAAAQPLPVVFSHIPSGEIRTVREWRPVTDREPANETLVIRGVMILAALLQGELRRADSDDDCDFLVASTRVRLAPEHIVGRPGEPLLMDKDGVPFAEEGEHVRCAGGFLPWGPVRGTIPIFSAGKISVDREAATPARETPSQRT